MRRNIPLLLSPKKATLRCSKYILLKMNSKTQPIIWQKIRFFFVRIYTCKTRTTIFVDCIRLYMYVQNQLSEKSIMYRDIWTKIYIKMHLDRIYRYMWYVWVCMDNVGKLISGTKNCSIQIKVIHISSYIYRIILNCICVCNWGFSGLYWIRKSVL